MSKDYLAVNALRFLGVDAINQANSGHPGIVLGAAPMAHALFSRHLNIYAKKPNWFNRDRFILSAGHGSMLLYGLLHLSGFKVSIEDLKRFRQLGNTPGHPEYGHTDGIEATTGPLGQGIANAVGMALAESHLEKRFNKPDFNIVNHYTYALCGDGDLQEGVALEAIALAGHLKLNKLIILFDSNDIQLDGATSLANSDHIKKKFESMNWQHILVNDGDNVEAVNKAIKKAKSSQEKPTLIEIKTIIGQGSPKAGTSDIHGSPLNANDTQILRQNLNWEYEPFIVPQEAYALYKSKVINRGKKEFNKWQQLIKEYSVAYPEDFALFEKFLSGQANLESLNSVNYELGSNDATRNMAGKVLNALSKDNLNIIGGSADLTASTKAKGADGNFLADHRLGRNINYGVREHAMGAIANGITLHGGLKTFVGGFFVFSDYLKPAIRLASIMNIPTTFVFTHDTIAVGEDGPTHQPIEQLAGLRAIPNLNVFRPADINEVKAGFALALTKQYPTALILTRQNVPTLENTCSQKAQKGAYIVSKEQNKLDGIILACGSEVSLALATQKELLKEGIDIRVVSMPSQFLFDQQPIKYQKEVLPKNIKTLAIEMGSTMPWYKYANKVLGIDTFGLSAPLNVVVKEFGFTVENVVTIFKSIV